MISLPVEFLNIGWIGEGKWVAGGIYKLDEFVWGECGGDVITEVNCEIILLIVFWFNTRDGFGFGGLWGLWGLEGV